MSLQSLVEPMLDLTDTEIAAALNAATVEKRDTQLWTWAGLALRFNPTIVGAIDEVLKVVPGMGWVRLLLAGTGIDFSLDATQDALEGMRAVEQLAPHIDNLKAVGRWNVSPWVNDGNEGTVTEEQVTEARTVIVSSRNREAVRQAVTTILNETIWPLVAAGGSLNDVKAAFAGA